MKTTLLFLCGLFALSANAQLPIQEFYGHLPVEAEYPYDGYSHRSYVDYQSDAPIDLSASGANVTWTFSGLTSTGMSGYTDSVPTAGDISTYPGTARVLSSYITSGSTQSTAVAYLSSSSSFVGLSADNGLVLNYTDPAFIGNFPLSYGYTNTDAIAGTYSYTTYSGTFTGSIVSAVDAYGTLNYSTASDGSGSYDVTRLKVIQTINLNYFPFGTVGTVSMTNYYYYFNTTDPLQVHFPTIASTQTVANIPLLSVNQDISTIEIGVPVFLGTAQFDRSGISLAPNPASNIVNIHIDDNIAIRSVTITDANGRIISRQNDGSDSINVSQLAKGIYFARIESDSGTAVKKFIKQ